MEWEWQVSALVLGQSAWSPSQLLANVTLGAAVINSPCGSRRLGYVGFWFRLAQPWPLWPSGEWTKDERSLGSVFEIGQSVIKTRNKEAQMATLSLGRICVTWDLFSAGPPLSWRAPRPAPPVWAWRGRQGFHSLAGGTGLEPEELWPWLAACTIRVYCPTGLGGSRSKLECGWDGSR